MLHNIEMPWKTIKYEMVLRLSELGRDYIYCTCNGYYELKWIKNGLFALVLGCWQRIYGSYLFGTWFMAAFVPKSLRIRTEALPKFMVLVYVDSLPPYKLHRCQPHWKMRNKYGGCLNAAISFTDGWTICNRMLQFKYLLNLMTIVSWRNFSNNKFGILLLYLFRS